MSNFQEKNATTFPYPSRQKNLWIFLFLENLSQQGKCSSLKSRHDPMFSLFQPSDHGIYWKINNERFHQYFRDKMLVAAINSKIDQVGSS